MAKNCSVRTVTRLEWGTYVSTALEKSLLLWGERWELWPDLLNERLGVAVADKDGVRKPAKSGVQLFLHCSDIWCLRQLPRKGPNYCHPDSPLSVYGITQSPLIDRPICPPVFF